ncbi:hypothetical protein POM88_009849 [Heracleum sosnowskyi]|uniref:DYW domain-containing protein n=1 Tax=Heracleum sosnowskyi TaxID=360622 RepID=A0AAD8JC89_9APIA|nr:hypothetical protein POM88_009849 [Heracleum sosnowskyi]
MITNNDEGEESELESTKQVGDIIEEEEVLEVAGEFSLNTISGSSHPSTFKVVDESTFACILRGKADFQYVKEIHSKAIKAGMTSDSIIEGALDLGEQIHTRVVKTGFQTNVYVCSVLIDIACAGIKASIKQGRQIHAQSILSGYSLDLSIGNALVSLYARCGRKEDAYVACNKIDEKDNITWNGLISGFSQSGHCEEALQVFSLMNQSGMEVNKFTYGSAVSAAANTANIKQGMQIHTRLIKAGYNAETEASNVLITFLDDAKREFIDLPEKNEISWNAVITGYSQHGRGTEALELFEEMKRLGFMPNYVIPISGFLGRARKFIEAMQIEADAMAWRTVLSWIEVKNSVHAFFVGDRLHPLAGKIYEHSEQLNKRATAAAVGYVQDRIGLWNDIEQGQKDPTTYIHSEKLAITYGLLSLSDTIPLRVMKNLRVYYW